MKKNKILNVFKMKFHLSYQVVIAGLLMIGVILTGGFVIIAHIYQVQDSSNRIIGENVASLNAARELEIALYNMRVISLNYIIDKDTNWISRLNEKESEFNQALEIAKESANTPEEITLLQQIAALFSNFQQNLKTGLSLHKQGYTRKSNALLLHASRDLINTIEDKCKEFIASNEYAQIEYETKIKRNNTIIRTAMYAMGIGGIILGSILGWIIARIILNPIYKLVLKVRGVAGNEVIEHINMSPGKELEELDYHIHRLISRINKANEDLEKNRLLLEKSNKLAALGKLAPAIAHEIRNPLAAIKMLIYSMNDESENNQERQEELEIIGKEIDRMEGFIQNFLKYARPGKPQMRTMNIPDLLHDTLHLLSPRLRQENISLTENYRPEHFQTLVDPDQIKQVIMNLVFNAIDSIGREGSLIVETELTAESDSQDGKEWLEIRIIDSGKGISDDIKDTLFDPFVKGKEQGTGLGLSISQRIIEQHHGWMEARNNPDKGATFSIHIPVS